MPVFLKSVDITNFRSISGSIPITLEAPVVLIHGPNAAGKTSVMSAIELALTGQIEAFKTDFDYAQHLVHRGSVDAQIMLTSDLPGSKGSAAVKITAGGVTGKPMLAGSERQFFTERCYLGQSLLSRLLEIYQRSSGEHKESPLTRFVNELLGVDALDALIEGLHMVGDIRNIRNAVPEYRRAEARNEKLEIDLSENGQLLADVDKRRTDLRDKATKTARSIWTAFDPSVLERGIEFEKLLASARSERDLQNLTTRRLELESIRQQWSEMSSHASEKERREQEKQLKLAQKQLDDWLQLDGSILNALIEKLDRTFTGLPNPSVVSPDYALEAAIAVVQPEVERCKKRLQQNDHSQVNLKRLGDEIKRAAARIGRIEVLNESNMSEAEDLAKILTDLMPHIHSDDCPVCGRDFRELKQGPLLNRVTTTVNRLSAKASEIRSLSIERSKSQAALLKLESERDGVKATEIAPADVIKLKSRIADLSEALVALRSLAKSAGKGAHLRAVASEKERRLLLLVKHGRLNKSLRRAIAELCDAIGVNKPAQNEDIEETIELIHGEMASRERLLKTRAEGVAALQDQAVQLVAANTDYQRIAARIREDETESKELQAELARANSQRASSKALLEAAARARSNVVNRVFTDSLNKLWHELFVRLAPDEAYVPSFKIPRPERGVLRVELETIHRRGGVGGPPSAMLSSGNLNTAALTLFLALHLSVEARVPLLMLDDPVQSMDEVHTIQLAALLRMLSKEQGSRQIIIAIHERSLFEYLAFELAPSFEGDRLITVQLSENEGRTVADCEIAEYKPETAVA